MQAEISSELSRFATERPELYKAVLAAIAEVKSYSSIFVKGPYSAVLAILCVQADKPGIKATVATAKGEKRIKALVACALRIRSRISL